MVIRLMICEYVYRIKGSKHFCESSLLSTSVLLNINQLKVTQKGLFTIILKKWSKTLLNFPIDPYEVINVFYSAEIVSFHFDLF